RQGTTHDEMIVSVHQDAHHVFHALRSSDDAWIGNRVTHREMVHHLSLFRCEIQIAVHLIVEKRANSSRP
ncbi:MAG TPA: hypothetical protein VF953_11630, partial [Terriglobales bacterium]